jgi:hypothetical protein
MAGSTRQPAGARNTGLYAAIAALLVLVIALAIVVVILLSDTGGGLVAATSTPGPGSSANASQIAAASGGASEAPLDTAGASLGPTPPPSAPASESATPGPQTTAPHTPAPSTAHTPAPSKTPTPSATPKPTITSFTGPATAHCDGYNGTGTLGYIHLSWTSTNTTGVRLAIDRPDVTNAYANFYMDYASSGSDDVPFSCDTTLSDSNGPYHLYMLITKHAASGYYQYKYIRVYKVG